ncbi:MAG: hypothetical protein ACR2RL_09355, partial [Gammaproteobacteria bacterium]
MKSDAILKKLTVPALLLGSLGLASAPALATDFFLIAKRVDINVPGGTVAMWGFAEDPGGACWQTTVGGANSNA